MGHFSRHNDEPQFKLAYGYQVPKQYVCHHIN